MESNSVAPPLAEQEISTTSMLCREMAKSLETSLLPIVNSTVIKLQAEQLKADREKDRALRKSAARISELETQLAAANQARLGLQQALDTYLTGTKQLTGSSAALSSSPNAPSDPQVLQREIETLNKKLNEVEQTIDVQAHAIQTLSEKLKSSKIRAVEWMRIAEKRKSKDSPMLVNGEDLPLPISVAPSDPHFVPTTHFTGTAVSENGCLGSESMPKGRGPGKDNLYGNIPSSQQETAPAEMSAFDQLPPQSNSSDDEPVVVKERLVKRRRKETSLDVTTAAERVRIKQEVLSPPKKLTRLDTLDLDNVSEHLVTANDVLLSRSNLMAGPNHDRAFSEPHRSRLNGPAIAPNINIKEVRNAIDARSQSHPPIGEDNLSTANRRGPDLRRILTPIDANLLSRPKSTGRKRNRASLDKVLGQLCEDGTVGDENAGHIQTSSRSDATLHALLEGTGNEHTTDHKLTSATKQINSISKKQIADSRSIFGVVPAPKATPRPSFNSPSHLSSGSNLSKKPLTPASSRPNLRPRTPAASLLRQKPKSSLTLSDFKINPKFNSGVGFAFNEAVYGEARKCYPGCTDSRCCGDAFRVLAVTLKPTLPRPMIPASQEDLDLSDDEFMLKWHMGGSWDLEEVRKMDDKERERHLLDARARYLAETQGKHRVVGGDRRMTPPDFWNMDIPNTQEVERIRREAERIDRQMVEERYAAAMRGGSKWMFADE